MARVRCMHCGAEADVEVDGQACGACGMEIPLVFGNTDLRSMGGGPPVPTTSSSTWGPPAQEQGIDVVPAFRPPVGVLRSQMPTLKHETKTVELELGARGPRGARGRAHVAGSLRHAAHRPVVQSSPLSRAVILILLCVAAYFAYAQTGDDAE